MLPGTKQQQNKIMSSPLNDNNHLPSVHFRTRKERDNDDDVGDGDDQVNLNQNQNESSPSPIQKSSSFTPPPSQGGGGGGGLVVTRQSDNTNNNNSSGGNPKTRILAQKDNIRIGREEFDDAFKWITARCHNGRITERHLKEQLFSVFGQSPKFTRKEFALLASDPDVTADKLWSSVLPARNTCEAFDTVAEAFAGGFDEDMDGFVDMKMMRKMWKKMDEEYPTSSTSFSNIVSSANTGAPVGAATASPPVAASHRGSNKKTSPVPSYSSKRNLTTMANEQQEDNNDNSNNNNIAVTEEENNRNPSNVNSTSNVFPTLASTDPFANVLKTYLNIADIGGPIPDGQIGLNDFREYCKKKKPPL